MSVLQCQDLFGTSSDAEAAAGGIAREGAWQVKERGGMTTPMSAASSDAEGKACPSKVAGPGVTTAEELAGHEEWMDALGTALGFRPSESVSPAVRRRRTRKSQHCSDDDSA